MNREMLNDVLKHLDALIAAELNTNDPGRYTRIAKLCSHAHQLLQMGVTRVGDVRDRAQGIVNYAQHYGPDDLTIVGEQAIGVDEAVAGGVQIGAGAVMPALRRRFDGGDAADLVREMVGALERHTEAVGQRNVEGAAQQLERLLDLRERLTELNRDTAMIDKKIDDATAALAAEEDPNADRPALARALVLRGHPAPVDQPEVLHPDRREADGPGARGAEGPGEEGEGEALDEVG